LFAREITISMENLLDTTTNPAHQLDAIRRDQAFQEGIRSRKIQILPRPQVQSNPTTIATLQSTADEEVAIKIAINPKSAERKTWLPRDITKHSEHIDRQDNLRKMEYELQKTAATPGKPQKPPVKHYTDLPPVDIYCIGAEGFNRNLKQLGTTAFITSLYKIN